MFFFVRSQTSSAVLKVFKDFSFWNIGHVETFTVADQET